MIREALESLVEAFSSISSQRKKKYTEDLDEFGLPEKISYFEFAKHEKVSEYLL
jgi:hypothetical protein